jgi:hypothetical protein
MRRLAALVFVGLSFCVAGCPALLSDDFSLHGDGGAALSDATAPASNDGGGSEGASAASLDAGADRDPSSTDAADASVVPRSCSDLREAGVQTDGTYTIDIDGTGSEPPFTVYCKDMNTVEPTEYLQLPANPEAGLPNSNVSGYAGGGGNPGCQYPPATLAFTKVRLDIQTLRIDPTDRTFSYFISEPPEAGAAVYALTQADNPGYQYASAGSCWGGGDSSGRGNADLTGTPFRMAADTMFVPYGYEPGNCSPQFSLDRKRVDLMGGGFSGWCYVAPDAGGMGIEFSP